VYAQADGSVAAPTAGLHFTQSVFNDLKEQQAQSVFVTLHVGAGTFKPVKSDTMQDHEMHKERILVSVNAIEKMCAAADNNRIIAVGTTSLRTIESIYWFGVKLLAQYEMKEFFVGQWEPYELADKTVEVSAALNAVLEWMLKNGKSYLNGYTQVLITPGYQIRMANALITNFHQPQSTLLLLVAALIGPDWKRVYNYALENNFRFLSFGDSSILFKNS
jgi:S-adenosylmethionine:tRNA ribosyltransferase-isomerase